MLNYAHELFVYCAIKIVLSISLEFINIKSLNLLDEKIVVIFNNSNCLLYLLIYIFVFNSSVED
jgi:hypothetical protein